MRKSIVKGNFAKRIAKLRRELMLSQAEFGARVGVTQQYIGALEAGSRLPSMSMLIAMAYKFNVREGWLILGNGQRHRLRLKRKV